MERVVTCPRADLEPHNDSRAVDRCERCGEDIYAGDDAYRIDGAIYCKDCIESFTFFEWLEFVNRYRISATE